MNYSNELNQLTKDGYLPDSNYLSAERFTAPFENSAEFWCHVVISGGLPLVNGLATCAYAARAVWAVMRAVGNLLILKPSYMLDALEDVSSCITLGLCLAVMAPIHALTNSIELLTRLMASWFVGQEPLETLSERGLGNKFSKEIDKHPTTLPSRAYFQSSRFFAPYKDATALIGQFFSPVAITFETSFDSLVRALKAVAEAIDLLTNIAICKPRHALQNARNLGINFSLSLGLAVMTPINALVESFAFVTRLLSTWVDACQADEQQSEYRRMSVN